MQDREINIIEALIFSSEEEITSRTIRDILSGFRVNLTTQEIEKAIDELNKKYTESGSAFEIIKIAGGYQFATRKEYALYIGKLFSEVQRKKLTQSAIETLSIIAYKQPVSRPEIEFIRGVNVDYIVNSLLERELITITGRATTPGRPILYGTTKNFLRVLGLNSLDELPKLKEINEILKNEKIEGITEADIDLFYSVNADIAPEKKEVTEEINFSNKSGSDSEAEITEPPQNEIENPEIDFEYEDTMKNDDITDEQTEEETGEDSDENK